MKKTLITLLVIISLVFLNGCYYVFNGQFRSVEKIKQGKDLNFYECCSVYCMHTALWMFAWPCSIAAANEVFLMQFSGEDVDIVVHKNNYIRKSVLSPRIVKTMKSLSFGESKKVSYNGNISYALDDPEHKAAMALNPCTVSKIRHDGKTEYIIRVDNSWPKQSETHIKLFGNFEIVLNEGLFRYLQDKNLICSFIDEYRYSEEEINGINISR